MSIFMVIGKFGCRKFATAEYFAEHLTTIVPHVKMKSQALTEKDFQVVLAKMRGVLHCEHTGSPLIWRDLEQIGTCPTYIGGVSELFDFCKEYYDIVMPLTEIQQEILHSEYIKKNVRESLKITKEKINEKGNRICIIGAGNPVAGLLLFDIIQEKLLYADNYLEIRLYEDRQDKKDTLKSLIWDIEGIECPDITKRDMIIIDNLYDAVKGCNLLIIMTEIERAENESYETWLMNNYNLMKDLAVRINEVDVISLKTMVTGIKLLCFNTAVLLKHSKVLQPQKTIAVTSHLGLEALQYVANVSKLSPSSIYGSPVWGYVGINQLVDTCHTKCSYCNWEIRKKPRKNPLKKYKPPLINFSGSPPLVMEKRDLCFRTHTCELMWQWVNSHRVVVKKTVGCFPLMSQVNATMSIIRLWLCQEYSKEIVSVGIKSDGSYGIPKGIVFSQPVILEDGQWQIYTKLPTPHYTIKLRNLFPLPIIISKNFSLTRNLPSIDDSFLPPKIIEPEQLSIIEQQKKLRAKREVLLSNIGTGDTENEDEIDETMRLKKKNRIINELKELRKEMKQNVESNPDNWFSKKIKKMKEEMEKEDLESVETAVNITQQSMKEENEAEEDEDEEEEGEGGSINLERKSEILEEIKNLNFITDLGIVYGNKILSKYKKTITPVDEENQKPKPRFNKEYRKTCEAKLD